MPDFVQKVARNIRRTGIMPRVYDVLGRTDASAVQDLLKILQPVVPVADLIRIGPQGDGGYLIPDDLDGIDYAFSPGVDRESGFEVDLAERGVDVFMADYSVDGPAQDHPRFNFVKKFLGSYTTPTQITLADWVRSSVGDHAGDLLLQMDIEGFEYEVLMNTDDALLKQMRIIVLELHEVGRLFERGRFFVFQAFFAKLLRNHHVVHIHPNNCCGSIKVDGVELPHILEMTLYRRDRPVGGFCRGPFPHPLDVKNVGSRPDLVLSANWYSAE